MTTAASGCITLAEEKIRDMLAACKTFQTWTGAASAAAAKAFIYYDAVPMPDQNSDTTPLAWNVSIRPFALIFTSTADGMIIDRSNVCSGNVNVQFFQNTPEQKEWEEIDRLFKNTISNILLSGDESNPGLWELSRTANYTHVNSIRFEGFYRSSEEDYDTMGDFEGAMVVINWGVTQ